MTPILGIMASAMSANLTPTTGFVSIATTTVGAGGASSVTFSGIPQVYKHLQIRAIGRNDSNVADARYTFNGDSGSNYVWHLLVGNGTSANAFSALSQTFLRGAPFCDNATNVFGTGITDILDYTSTNKNKTVRTLTGMENNTSTYSQIQFYSGLWMNTAAITSITITPSGGNFTQYSSLALYGIQGA